MSVSLLLASASEARARLLRQAGLEVETMPARIDEDSLRASMAAEGLAPRDQADLLAEAKAQKIGARHPERLVLGADQILEVDGTVLGKPESPDHLEAQLRQLAGRVHALHSAAVLFEQGRPTWRHVATARMHMRALSDTFVAAYVARHWESVRHSVGGYMIEGEGVRLFARIEGDLFTVQGLPLLPLLTQLAIVGVIET